MSGAPCPAVPKLGTLGGSWIARPMPCPASSRSTRKPCRSTSASTAAPTAPVVDPARATAIPPAGRPRRRRKRGVRGRHRRHGHRDRRVGHVAAQLGRHVELDQVAGRDQARPGDAVHGLVVHADARDAGEVVGQLRRRAGAVAGEDLGRGPVELRGGRARAYQRAHAGERLGHHPPRRQQRLHILARTDRHQGWAVGCWSAAGAVVVLVGGGFVAAGRARGAARRA